MYLAGRSTKLLNTYITSNEPLVQSLVLHWSLNEIKVASSPTEGVVDAVFWAEDIGYNYNIAAAILSGEVYTYDHSIETHVVESMEKLV